MRKSSRRSTSRRSEKADEDDICQLRTIAANRKAAVDNSTDILGAHYIRDGAVERPCVYTDGSSMLNGHSTLAYTDWGISYSLSEDRHSDAEPLKSCCQTSYHAEVRAVAQCQEEIPMLVCCDCKGVVKVSSMQSRGKND